MYENNLSLYQMLYQTCFVLLWLCWSPYGRQIYCEVAVFQCLFNYCHPHHLHQSHFYHHRLHHRHHHDHLVEGRAVATRLVTSSSGTWTTNFLRFIKTMKNFDKKNLKHEINIWSFKKTRRCEEFRCKEVNTTNKKKDLERFFCWKIINVIDNTTILFRIVTAHGQSLAS